MKKLKYLLSLLTLLTFQNCGGDDFEIPDRKIGGPVITVTPATTYQTIAGFGGANQMWGVEFPDEEDMQKAFSTEEEGLGLSIFRIRIPSNPNEWQLMVDNAKLAQQYGAKIMASPWSPPPALKSNNSDISGYLPEENYEAYAKHINDFVDYMASNDVGIYAISIQNEPDIEVSYESCDWTASAMRDFLRDYGSTISNVKIAAPESYNFNQGFSDVLLNDAGASDNMDIVAGHIYGGGLNAYPLAESKGKEIWMTEYLLNQNAGDWEGISDEIKWDETMNMLNTMHQSMTNNWNAYIWWYLKRYYSFIGDSYEGSTDGEILKRGYAFSQFSKFIRPGYTRVGTTDKDNSGLSVTAYQGDDKIIAVLINATDTPVADVYLSVDGSQTTAASSFTTSLIQNRVKKDYELTDGTVILSVSAKSITTVVMEL